LLVGVLSSAASAQTVFEPVRYQYGQYSEVYYGGRNPALTSGTYVYLPPALQAPYAVVRQNIPPVINGYTPGGQGWPFYSPYMVGASPGRPVYTPLLFSDYLPYHEVGQFGYTVNDVRNEAYANVPRLQGARDNVAAAAGPQPPAPAAPAAQPTPAADPRWKAVPLLNWAKNERTRNPQLYQALLAEARKYDAAAAAALDRGGAK
jgi:hypothetical protein